MCTFCGWYLGDKLHFVSCLQDLQIFSYGLCTGGHRDCSIDRGTHVLPTCALPNRPCRTCNPWLQVTSWWCMKHRLEVSHVCVSHTPPLGCCTNSASMWLHYVCRIIFSNEVSVCLIICNSMVIYNLKLSWQLNLIKYFRAIGHVR